MKLRESSLVELQQRRHSILAALLEANKEKDDDGARVAARGLEAELSDVSAEIGKREGRQADEADAARRKFNPQAEYERGAILTPNQSVRSYLEDNGHVKQRDFADLRLGSLLRSMVMGPKNDLERRALAEGSDSTGGVSVPDITLSRFIDNLRAAQVCVQAGAMTVPLTSDRTTIARTASDPVAAWRAEAGPVDESDPTFEGVVLVPRSLAVMFKVSRELIEDSLNIESALEAALRGSLAVELDRVCLRGSGTPPEPEGIVNITGVNHVPAAGPLGDYDPIIDAMALNWADNEPVTSAVIMSPANLAILLKLKETSTDAYLRRPEIVPPLMMTTSMDDDTAILGNFGRLLIGLRTSLRIEVLRELYAENLQYGFIAHMRADVGVEHPESFAKISNLTAS